MKKSLSFMMIIFLLIIGITGCDSELADYASVTEAGAGNVFVIGSSGPLTEDLARYGKFSKQGAELAIQEINSAGGVKVGEEYYQLELNYENDEGNPDKAPDAYKRLKKKGINAMLGPCGTANCAAISEDTYKDNMLQIITSTGRDSCTDYSNAFRLCFSEKMQGESMAEYAVNTLGLKKIGVITVPMVVTSQNTSESFIKKVQELGGEITASETALVSTNDFSTQLASIRDSGAEIIFFASHAAQMDFMMKQARDMGMDLPFIGNESCISILKQTQDVSAIEGLVYLSLYLEDDPELAEFIAAYREAFLEEPDEVSMEAYEGVYLIKAAMEKAGSIKSEDLIAAMDGLTVESVNGTISFNGGGDPEKKTKLVKIIDGKKVLITGE